MSHEIQSDTFDYKCDRKQVFADFDYLARCDARGENHGLYQKIEWLDLKLDSEEAVNEYMREHRKVYQNLAVSYYDADGDLSKDKRYNEAHLSTLKCADALHSLECEKYLSTLTSEFITCKQCGSKIAREKWANYGTYNGNRCPVCGNDFRPEYWMNRIGAAHTRWMKAREKEDKAFADYRKNHRVLRWYVTCEWHC